MKKEIKNILVTGSVGQIGSELTLELRKKYGAENVVATGRKTEPSKELKESGPFHFINVNDPDSVEEMIKKYDIDTVIHMAAILSGVGEKNPMLAWDVNMNGTLNILNLAVKHEMARVIIPSSIAVWGPDCPHCRVQMPYAAALYDRLDLAEVNYVTLSVSGTEDEISEYLDEHDLTFPVLWGESGEYGDGYEQEGWPTTFVFAPGGELTGWCDICGPAYLTEMMDLIAEAGGPPVRPSLLDRSSSRAR